MLSIHTEEGDGDILAFLPGQQEIEAACRMIREGTPEGGRELVVHALYANLPWGVQMRAMAPLRWNPVRNCMAVVSARRHGLVVGHSSQCGYTQLCCVSRQHRGGLRPRKVVVATNIAETSVTIEGVVYVVDSGFVKV